VRNLNRYQHYRDRRPPWVKLYVSILHDSDFAALSVPARLLFLYCICIAANRSNRIPDDANWLSVETSLPRSSVAKSLSELLASEYLIPASAIASNGARAETETETETYKNTKYVDVGEGS
jgi:hypothetical protein